eukprot:gene17221-19633_t
MFSKGGMMVVISLGALTIEVGQNLTSTLIAPKATKATFLYIVGVEGVGHHGVSPAIASIAQYCQQRVVYEHKVLRTHLSHMSTLKFKTTLAQLTTVLSPKSVLFIEGSSFPTDGVRRNSPDSEKRLFGLYNINWLYNQAKQATIDIKFLHLTRDFYRTVASHPEFDGTFEKHAEVLHNFTRYIDTEYRSIEAKESGLWRQIKYEWFTEMDSCTALAAAIVDFMGWSECNLSQACAILREDLRPPTPRAVNETEYTFAQTFDVNVSTPLLNISLSSNYSFVDNPYVRVPVLNISRIPGRPRWVPDTTPVSRYAFPNIANKHYAHGTQTFRWAPPIQREQNQSSANRDNKWLVCTAKYQGVPEPAESGARQNFTCVTESGERSER